MGNSQSIVHDVDYTRQIKALDSALLRYDGRIPSILSEIEQANSHLRMMVLFDQYKKEFHTLSDAFKNFWDANTILSMRNWQPDDPLLLNIDDFVEHARLMVYDDDVYYERVNITNANISDLAKLFELFNERASKYASYNLPPLS
jgi:hypothetical protein